MSSYILPFSSIEATLARAGGKGANLAELVRAGFPVPPGFIVTTDAYCAFVEANQLQPRLLTLAQNSLPDDSAALENTSAEIRSLFEQGTLPAEITAEITSAYHTLLDSHTLTLSSPPVAVRSSATAEDLPGLAFAGYRQPTLPVELDGARQILEAAGIICTVEHTAGVLPSAIDAVLAWTVREGVTNVIRHSRAQRCTIRLSGENGRACVEVINDGYREQEHGPAHTRVSSGLSGLTERVTAHKGLVEAGPLLFEGNPGFRLQVELPIRGSETDERERQR